MHVFLLGVSHQTAPIAVREQLDFSSRDVGAAVEAVAARYSAGEAVVLSTCNRSEIYVASDNPARARRELIEFLHSYHGLPTEAFESHVFVRTDEDASRHLFRVAAGLDSLVVGEPQILGQVKTRSRWRRRASASARCSRASFHTSFVGKRVRPRPRWAKGDPVGFCRGGAGAQDFRPPRRAAACWSSAPANQLA
jgi:glutamyl-tRNA reductase